MSSFEFQNRLESLGFASYIDYLESPHWRSVRDTYRRSGRPQRCAVCRSRRFQLHHLTYAHLGSEVLDDLVALCGFCHRDTHRLERSGIEIAEAHRSVAAPKGRRGEPSPEDRRRARRKGYAKLAKDRRAA